MRATAADIEGRVDRALERCFTTRRAATPRPKVTKATVTAAPHRVRRRPRHLAARHGL
jgi:hypothetical protein